MGKRLGEKNPFLRDAEKKRLMISAIASAQRQEGIEISEARAEESYRIAFEEPPVAFLRLVQAGEGREELFIKALRHAAKIVRLAGGSLATLYSEFGSKEALFAEIMRRRAHIMYGWDDAEGGS